MMLVYSRGRVRRVGGVMAKKPKKQDDEEEGVEAAEGEEGAVAAPSKKKRMIIIGGAAALVLLLGGGGAFFFLGSSGEDDAADASATVKPVAFLDVREMIVNLAPEPNEERRRFLKFRVALEVSDPAIIGEIEPLMPRVEDTFQVFVRELRASELDGSAGVYRLREELLRRVNIAVHPARVDAVLFKEVVVQ
jgi:flagellar FliL protein